MWIHVPTANWAIADSNIAPASGVAIGEWTEFVGTITMPFDIFAVAENAKDGDIAVTYKNTSRTITYNLPASKYAVSGKTISFVLPTEPVKGDIISVSVKEGIAFDVYGNPNGSYSSENVVWKYVGFIPTMDMILGNFDLLYISYYDETGSVESLGNVSIEANSEVTNGIIIKDFFLEGSELEGTVNFDECKIYIPDGQVLGTYKNSTGTTYGLVFYTADETDAAAFTINSDGSMVADGLWGVYAYDETFTSGLGWFDVAAASMFSPVKASASAKKVLKKSAKTKTVKNTTRKLNKRVSK